MSAQDKYSAETPPVVCFVSLLAFVCEFRASLAGWLTLIYCAEDEDEDAGGSSQ